MKPLTRYALESYVQGRHERHEMTADPGGKWYAKDEADARIRHFQDEALCAEEAAMTHAQRIAELEPSAKWFGEVMAILHGDGGHYVAKHGAEKAALDAVAKYHALHAELERLRQAGMWQAAVQLKTKADVETEFNRAEAAEAQRDYFQSVADGRVEEFAALVAERDEARADAERYRWLRDSLEGNLAEGYEIVERAFRGGLDAAIDAARSKE